MSANLDLPEWADDIDNPPAVTAYAGSIRNQVPWQGGTTRRSYQIMLNGQMLLLNMHQALAVAETIIRDANRSIHVDH